MNCYLDFILVQTQISYLSDAMVCFHGVGGRTVHKLRTYDVHVVRRLKHDVIILEQGTNNLTNLSLEVVGSEIEELVSLL